MKRGDLIITLHSLTLQAVLVDVLSEGPDQGVQFGKDVVKVASWWEQHGDLAILNVQCWRMTAPRMWQVMLQRSLRLSYPSCRDAIPNFLECLTAQVSEEILSGNAQVSG